MRHVPRLLVLATALTLLTAIPALADGEGVTNAAMGHRNARYTAHVQPAPNQPYAMVNTPGNGAPRPADWRPGRAAGLIYWNVSTALHCLHGSVSW